VEHLKNSALFRWRLKRASNTNPLHSLLKSDKTKSGSEKFISVFTATISAIAAISGIVAILYVSGKAHEFGRTGNNGVKSINSSVNATIDTHHVCIPPINGTITVTLPNPTTLNVGKFVSASLPLSMPPESVSDNRSAFVTYGGTIVNTGLLGGIGVSGAISYKIPQNSGSLFVVSRELTDKKWKLIREWPNDNNFTAGS
jgi:hypothetical protein